MRTTDMNKIREAQPEWFSRKNKKFFGDVSYRSLKGKISGKPFLVRSTFAWSDMFAGNRNLHYRIHVIKDDYTIGSLIDKSFKDIESVKAYLRTV